MPFVEQAVGDAREGYLVDEDEYDLTIVSCEDKESKKGKPMLEIIIEFDEHPDAEPIFYYFNFVSEDDSEKARKFKLRMQRRFLEVFNIPFEDSGFDTDDFQGAKGRCLVYQQERVDDQGQPLNPPEFSHALRLPKFGGEAEEQEEAPRRGQTRPERGARPATRRPPPPQEEPEPEEEVIEEEPTEEEVLEEQEQLEEEQLEEEQPEEEPQEEEPPPPPVSRRPQRPAAPQRPQPPARPATAAKAPARTAGRTPPPPPRRR